MRRASDVGGAHCPPRSRARLPTLFLAPASRTTTAATLIRCAPVASASAGPAGLGLTAVLWQWPGLPLPLFATAQSRTKQQWACLTPLVLAASAPSLKMASAATGTRLQTCQGLAVPRERWTRVACATGQALPWTFRARVARLPCPPRVCAVWANWTAVACVGGRPLVGRLFP